MKTYVIDWGEKANGGRYALIQARSFTAAWLDADSVGGPFDIAELKIPRGDPEQGDRYMEFDAPNERYAGVSIDELEWQQSSNLWFEEDELNPASP